MLDGNHALRTAVMSATAIVYDNRLFCQEHVKLELGERSLE